MADEEREMEEQQPRQPVEHFGEAHMEVDLSNQPHPLEQPEGEPEPDDEPEEEK